MINLIYTYSDQFFNHRYVSHIAFKKRDIPGMWTFDDYISIIVASNKMQKTSRFKKMSGKIVNRGRNLSPKIFC